MRRYFSLFLLILVTVGFVRPQLYTGRYDNINLDDILNNRRLLVSYINCVLDQGKCTAAGRELRSHIKEALDTGCAKCTADQQQGTRRVLAHLIKNEPNYWIQLKAKYDNAGKYSEMYEKELRQLQA